MGKHDKWRKFPDATESYQNYIGFRICLLAKVSSTCELTRYSGTCYRHGTSAEFPPDDHPLFDPREGLGRFFKIKTVQSR